MGAGGYPLGNPTPKPHGGALGHRQPQRLPIQLDRLSLHGGCDRTGEQARVAVLDGGV